jgi:hypothetical protein
MDIAPKLIEYHYNNLSTRKFCSNYRGVGGRACVCAGGGQSLGMVLPYYLTFSGKADGVNRKCIYY